MLIKNNTLAPYMVQGITLIPGGDGTEIPEDKQELVLRDIEGTPGLEVVKERAKPGPKAKDQDEK